MSDPEKNLPDGVTMTYPPDIVADADSRQPWKSEDIRTWYMEGRMFEREQPAVPVDSEQMWVTLPVSSAPPPSKPH